MSRFIAVQRSADALFAHVEIDSIENLEIALAVEVAQWATPGDYRLDTDRYASETTDDFAVYEVPEEIVYDADQIDANDVLPGRVFANYRTFPFVGFFADVTDSDELAA